MWCLNYSVTIPSTAHPPFAKLPDSVASMNCWATTWKHVENVDFNGLNQIGWLVALHSHSKDGRSDRIVTMRWITSNMYNKDKHTVSIWSWWRCRYISISAGNYFHRYIIIPATINHHRIYNYKWLYINRQFVVLHKCTQTLFISNIFMRWKKS